MDFDYSTDEQAFRGEVRAFIEQNLPPAGERPKGFMKDWLTKVREKGWVGFSWPKEFGGGSGGLIEQTILREEMARAKAPPLGTSFMGLAWVGPGIMQYGTQEQKQRFIPDILDSKVNWCTGYSEPNHGSDLAAIQCKAVREGDHYVVNGQKIWTTGAPFADWIILLVRTDFDVEVKHQGITCLLVPMDAPGLEVRPIENMAGDRHFAEVFFSDVRVPVENRLGEENQGWTLAKYLLSLERFGTAEISRSMASLERLKKIAMEEEQGGCPLIEDADFAGKLAEAEIELRALEVTEQRFLFGPGGADALGAEASMLKVRGTEIQQRILELTLEALAYYGHPALPDDLHQRGDNEPPVGPAGSRFAARAYFNFRKTSIYSGSNEIQKNIIAKAVLGL